MTATTIVINDVEPRRQYTAASGQTVFDFPIPFFDDGDLEVYLTPVGQIPDDTNDILTITTEYTVAGADTQDGGEITLVTPATLGDVITIERVVDIDRTADYQKAGDFLAETLNREQDTEIMISQQLRQSIDRCLQLPSTTQSTGADLTLPEPVALNLFRWNAAGDALEAVSLTGAGGISIPVTISEGGTGSDNAPDARVALGLEIGVDVQAYDADILKADTTDNLTVGFTTDVEALGSVTSITPDLTNEWIKTATITGNLTINEVADGNEGGCIIYLTADGSGPYTVTLGTGCEPIGTIPDLAASTTYECKIIKSDNARTTVEIVEVG